MNLLLPELITAVGVLRFAMLCKDKVDGKPEPEGPCVPNVVFDPVVRLPVPIELVGKVPLPVGLAVGPPPPPVTSVRGYGYGV